MISYCLDLRFNYTIPYFLWNCCYNYREITGNLTKNTISIPHVTMHNVGFEYHPLRYSNKTLSNVNSWKKINKSKYLFFVCLTFRRTNTYSFFIRYTYTSHLSLCLSFPDLICLGPSSFPHSSCSDSFSCFLCGRTANRHPWQWEQFTVKRSVFCVCACVPVCVIV